MREHLPAFPTKDGHKQLWGRSRERGSRWAPTVTGKAPTFADADADADADGAGAYQAIGIKASWLVKSQAESRDSRDLKIT